MDFDFERLIRVIVESANTSGPITPRMLAVIDECERQTSHQDWTIIRALDYQADISRLGQWVSTAISALPALPAPHGLWVGICNPCDDPQDMASVRTDVYLSLCARFDSSTNDWAYESLVTTECMNSDVLRAVHETAYGTEGGLGDSAEYPIALAYGAMITIEALTHAPFRLLSSLNGAVCGFDSGDSLFVGRFEDGVFCRSVRPL